MKAFRGFAAVILLVMGAAAGAQEAAPATKEQQVRELLVLLRAGEMGVQVVDGMIGSMKEALPSVPEEYWTKFRQQVKASDLVDLLVPVYAKHLEAADVEGLIRFYRSPTGQRFLDKQPVILQESMAIGQKWGEQLAAKAIKDIQAEQ